MGKEDLNGIIKQLRNAQISQIKELDTKSKEELELFENIREYMKVSKKSSNVYALFYYKICANQPLSFHHYSPTIYLETFGNRKRLPWTTGKVVQIPCTQKNTNLIIPVVRQFERCPFTKHEQQQ